MKLRSAPILGCLTFVMTLAMDVRCDMKDVLGGGILDGLWFAAAVSAANQSDDQLQDQIDDLQDQVDDISGRPQPDGATCWDLDGDDVADPEEDVNNDGVWDANDCQGGNCWDTIGDYNNDAVINAQDCLDWIADESDGGTDGANCYDTIGDYNGDSTTDGDDCLDWILDQVPDGQDGGNCWDEIGDYNNDGTADSQDCLDWVVDNVEVEDGEDGQDGGNCWDGIGDVNEDGVADADDCLAYILLQVEDEGDVIARGFINSFGEVERGSRILDTTYIDVGEYDVLIDLSASRTDLTEPDLTADQFPVLLTVYATTADPLPWSDNIGALVAHYKYDAETSLDVENARLRLRVYILQALTGDPVSAGFSVVIMEP